MWGERGDTRARTGHAGGESVPYCRDPSACFASFCFASITYTQVRLPKYFLAEATRGYRRKSDMRQTSSSYLQARPCDRRRSEEALFAEQALSTLMVSEPLVTSIGMHLFIFVKLRCSALVLPDTYATFRGSHLLDSVCKLLREQHQATLHH